MKGTKRDPMRIAFWVVNEFLKKKREFTMEELEDEIIKRGGIFRIAPNYPVRDFIKELEADGLLKRKGEKFIPVR